MSKSETREKLEIVQRRRSAYLKTKPLPTKEEERERISKEVEEFLKHGKIKKYDSFGRLLEAD